MNRIARSIGALASACFISGTVLAGQREENEHDPCMNAAEVVVFYQALADREKVLSEDAFVQAAGFFAERFYRAAATRWRLYAKAERRLGRVLNWEETAKIAVTCCEPTGWVGTIGGEYDPPVISFGDGPAVRSCTA